MDDLGLFSVIPNEVINHIFSFVPVREAIPLDSVCSVWREVLTSDPIHQGQRRQQHLLIGVLQELRSITRGIRHVLNQNANVRSAPHCPGDNGNRDDVECYELECYVSNYVAPLPSPPEWTICWPEGRNFSGMYPIGTGIISVLVAETDGGWLEPDWCRQGWVLSCNCCQ